MTWGLASFVVRLLRADTSSPVSAGNAQTSAAYGPVFRTSRKPKNDGLDTSALAQERAHLIALRATMVKRHKRRSTYDARLRQVTRQLLEAGQ